MAEVVAETQRLRLRTWDLDDEFRFFDVMNTPAVMRWLGGLQTRDEWSAGFNRLQTYQRDFGFTFWLVERKSDGQMLGFCGLKRANAPGADAIAGEVEIGWRLREDAWGKGYAKEAATASLELAFCRFGAKRVVAVLLRATLQVRDSWNGSACRGERISTSSISVSQRIATLIRKSYSRLMPRVGNQSVLRSYRLSAAWIVAILRACC